MRAAMGLGALLAISGLNSGSFATETGDAAAGALVAGVWCGNCHVTVSRPPGPVDDAAPSFPSIARQPYTTSMSLRVFLQTPHRDMPNYQLSQTELDDVVAYILSLRGSR